MRHNYGAIDEHGRHSPHGGRGIHQTQHHQALRQGPQPCVVLQLDTPTPRPQPPPTEPSLYQVKGTE